MWLLGRRHAKAYVCDYWIVEGLVKSLLRDPARPSFRRGHVSNYQSKARELLDEQFSRCEYCLQHLARVQRSNFVPNETLTPTKRLPAISHMHAPAASDLFHSPDYLNLAALFLLPALSTLHFQVEAATTGLSVSVKLNFDFVPEKKSGPHMSECSQRHNTHLASSFYFDGIFNAVKR